MTIRVGQVGRASTSARLGAADPRLRRNAQQNTNDRDISGPLFIDQNGKLNLKLAAPLRVVNGQVTIDFAALAGSLPATFPINVEEGKVALDVGGPVAVLDSAATLALAVAKINELLTAMVSGGLLKG